MYAGRLIDRVGAGRLIAAGSLAAFLGYVWCLGTGTPAPLVTVSLVGVGYLLAFSALHFQAIAGVPPDRQRVVSGVYQTSVQGGGALVLVVIAFVTGLDHQPALLLVTAVAATGLLVAMTGTRSTAAGGEKPCPPTRSKSLSS
jgi:hypothetical protein